MFDLGVLALRLVLGAVFLGHGAQKAFGAFGGPGFAGATGFVGSLGFRPARVWAAMAVAIAKVHGPKGFFVQNGGYEYNLVLIVAALAVAAMGPGRYSLDHLVGLAR